MAEDDKNGSAYSSTMRDVLGIGSSATEIIAGLFSQIELATKDLPEFVADGTVNTVKSSVKNAKDVAEKGVQMTAIVADGTSDAATAGAVAGFGISFIGAMTGNPAFIAAGVKITATSLSIGTGADVTSTLAKTADAVFFDGSSDVALSQAKSAAVNVISGRVFNSLTSKVVTRTGLSAGPLFRSAQSGQFISNVQGFATIAPIDATRVVIGLGY